MSDANKALVRRHFEQIWNADRMAVCDELMAADYVEHATAPFASSEPGQVNGPDHTRATAAWLRGQFPDITMAIEAILAEGDLVVARVHSEGTSTGAAAGAPPPTGRRFSAAQTHWFRVANGQLAEHWATRDDLTSMIQLGHVVPPGPPAARHPDRSPMS